MDCHAIAGKPAATGCRGEGLASFSFSGFGRCPCFLCSAPDAQHALNDRLIALMAREFVDFFLALHQANFGCPRLGPRCGIVKGDNILDLSRGHSGETFDEMRRVRGE